VSSKLYAQGHPLRARDAQVEDYVAAQLTLGNGTVAQLTCSWRVHAGCDCVIEASFFGSAGGVSFRNVNGSFYDFETRAFTGTAARVLAAPPDAWGGRTLQEWLRSLTHQRGFDPEAERYVHVARALDQIYAAGTAAVPAAQAGAL
jgi:predicted dehydrogenase